MSVPPPVLDYDIPAPVSTLTKSDITLTVSDPKEEEFIKKRELVVFGTDVGSVPCFRNSFLYGITGGMGSGIVHFALTSRVPAATTFGFYSYVGITLSYWIYCRYNYSATKFQYTQLQYAMQQSTMYEGTEKEMPRTP